MFASSSTRQKIVVEFVGPSGVGKSTLFNYFLSQYGPTGNCRHWRDARKHLRPKRTVTPGLLDAYDFLLRKKIVDLQTRDVDEHTKARLEEFFRGNLDEDRWLSKSPARGIFLREDGIFHNFTAELLAVSNTHLEALTKGRAFVHIDARANVIVSRVMRRESQGGSRPQYAGKTREEVAAEVNDGKERKSALVDRLVKAGHKVLNIDASNLIEEQALTLDNFAKELKTWR